MNARSHSIASSVLIAALLSACAMTGREPARVDAADRGGVDELLVEWTPGPRLAAREMIAKYGMPEEATADRLVWHDAGPFKRIMVTREELPHDFPITHMDYLEHTISYRVPPEKVGDVLAFDASITIYPVGGELSARCDLESNNILTLNLANDIVTGKKTVEQARQEFPRVVMQRALMRNPPSALTLQFQPVAPELARRIEAVTVEGTPVRAVAARNAAAGRGGDVGVAEASGRTDRAAADGGKDAEILATLITLDEDEVHAAMTAQQKKNVAAPVLDYAKMLHAEHGEHLQRTIELGARLGITPVETKAVEALHAKNATALADVVALDGERFARAFLEMMVDGHRDAIAKVDESLRAAGRAEIREHLERTREHLVMHLQRAEALSRGR